MRSFRHEAGTIEAARDEGVRVPQTEVISNIEGLRKWVARTGLPAVLKADGSSGGDGVRIVRTTEQAECAFRSLSNPPLWARATKRALINRDTTLVRPSIFRRRPTVNAQAFVLGHEATSTVVCWKGSVLAALHFEVLNKVDSTGPATVLRLIEDAEISDATRKIARRLKLSGVHGFDFMRETRTGNAYLIEMNPRTTQVGHLAFGPGRDLPAALYAAVSGEAIHEAEMVTEKDTIALFPQEWIRDSASPYLRSTYHDVPWEAPDLVLACIRARRRQFAWNSPKEDLRAFRELLSFTYRGSTIRAAPNGMGYEADEIPISVNNATLNRMNLDSRWNVGSGITLLNVFPQGAGGCLPNPEILGTEVLSSIMINTAIIGAGPYGLSVAAHFRRQGIPFRIFGRPMDSWLAHMPKGMLLKSDGFASNIYDPEDEFPLRKFCAERGIEYSDDGSSRAA